MLDLPISQWYFFPEWLLRPPIMHLVSRAVYGQEACFPTPGTSQQLSSQSSDPHLTEKLINKLIEWIRMFNWYPAYFNRPRIWSIFSQSFLPTGICVIDFFSMFAIAPIDFSISKKCNFLHRRFKLYGSKILWPKYRGKKTCPIELKTTPVIGIIEVIQASNFAKPLSSMTYHFMRPPYFQMPLSLFLVSSWRSWLHRGPEVCTETATLGRTTWLPCWNHEPCFVITRIAFESCELRLDVQLVSEPDDDLSKVIR